MKHSGPRILLIGTADTKADELVYLNTCLAKSGASARIMDVGILGDPPFEPEYSRHAVAEAAGTTNQQIIDLGDENRAMVKQAEGASRLAAQLVKDGKIDGMLAIGGSMATDLALDVAESLPIGMPKVIVSTIAHSAILPPERISPDAMMVLWAGGLYGLNPVCRSVLSQAAGAVVGACLSVEVDQGDKPLIGMTSLGKSSLKYMVHLKPELEKRGFELAVFHTTGMGGRALEALASQRQLAAVLDFSLIEVSNHVHGSVVTAGAKRLEAAGAAGIPQIVAPGGVTLVDLRAWAEVPSQFSDREFHTHNRLIACAKLNPEERAASARSIVRKLNKTKGPTTFIMPLRGIDEWDREGGPFHDDEGLNVFAEEIRSGLQAPVELIEIDAHINDRKFAVTVLAVVDRWIEQGIIRS